MSNWRERNKKVLNLQSARWYGPTANAPASAAIVVGREYALPFNLTEAKAPVALGIRVGTAGTAAARVRLGIRADNNGVPGTLLHDGGTVTVDATGDRTITLTSPPTLPPQKLWLVALFETDGAPASVFCNVATTPDSVMQEVIGQTNMGGLVGTNTPITGIYATTAFAALGTSYGTVVYNSGVTPYIGIKF